MEGIKKEEFEKFTKEMWERLKFGEKKYGCQYKAGDIAVSIREEFLDVGNYAFMLALKVQALQDKWEKEHGKL